MFQIQSSVLLFKCDQLKRDIKVNGLIISVYLKKKSNWLVSGNEPIDTNKSQEVNDETLSNKLIKVPFQYIFLN